MTTRSLRFLLFLVLLTTPLPAYQAGEELSIPMPELGDMNHVDEGTGTQETRLVIQLPDDYDDNGQFGLFVYIEGGAGNNKTSYPFALTDRNGWIIVPLPKQLNRVTSTPWTGYYDAMMAKVYETVGAQIHPSRRVLVGHSLGAFELGHLLRSEPEALAANFDAFLPGAHRFAPEELAPTPLDEKRALFADKPFLFWSGSRDLTWRPEIYADYLAFRDRMQGITTVEWFELQTVGHKPTAEQFVGYFDPNQYGVLPYVWLANRVIFPNNDYATIRITGEDGETIESGERAPSYSAGTDFGDVELGSTVSKFFTVHNEGSALLNLIHAQFYWRDDQLEQPVLVRADVSNPSPFSLASALPTIAPGTSAQIEVLCSPTAVGSQGGLIEFVNAATVPYAFRLEVNGTEQGTTAPVTRVTTRSTAVEASEDGLRPARFRIERSGSLASALTVHLSWPTLDGGQPIFDLAEAGVDYELPPATVVIPVGERVVDFSVTPLADTLDEGLERIRLELLPDDAYAFGERFVEDVFLADFGHDQWLDWYFDASEQADPAVSDDLADPDGDGLSNLLEYAFGSSPRAASGLPIQGLRDAVSGQLQLAYWRQAGRPGLQFVTERHDPGSGSWVDATASVSVQVGASQEGVEQVEVTDMQPIAPGDSHLLRLRIERN